jgi:glycosyltransferase involved in cell wall biosynthesis
VTNMGAFPDRLVSVIVPVHNCALYLRECLESIQAQEAEVPLEVVVIDDASSDGSGDIAAEFSGAVRVVRLKEKSGAAAARNKGLEASRGGFFAFLDADDRRPAGSLLRQLAVLDASQEIDMVLGGIRQFFSPDAPDSLKERVKLPRGIQPGYVLGAMVIRRGSFARVGDFSTDVKVGEFIEWFCRARAAGLRAEVIDDVVLERRIHAGNTMLHSPAVGPDFLRIAHANLLLKRSGEDRTADKRESGDA